MPALTSAAAAKHLDTVWQKASRELTGLIPSGIVIDRKAIAAGRVRVTEALNKLSDPNCSLDDAVDEIVTELGNVAGYPSLGNLVEKSGFTGPKRKALAEAVRAFENASFSGAMACVALLEHADQLTTNDSEEETLAKLRLVDTADRLYDDVGDPPIGLRINADEEPAAYIKYACAGLKVNGLSSGHGPETFQEEMTRALRAFGGASNESARCGAIEGVTDIMSQLHKTTQHFAGGRTQDRSKARDGAELALVFTEAVRQVAGLQPRGDGEPRPSRPDPADVKECEALARSAVTRIKEEERKTDHSHAMTMTMTADDGPCSLLSLRIERRPAPQG